MRIYISPSRGDQILLDDYDYDRLIIQQQYVYYVRRIKRGHIESAYRYVQDCFSDTGKSQFCLIHHDIIGKPLEGLVTDHRDVNPLNNQRSNLRHITQAENARNRKPGTSSSDLPGVSWSRIQQKWQARLGIRGITYNLGFFIEELEAFQAVIDYISHPELFKRKAFSSIYQNVTWHKVLKKWMVGANGKHIGYYKDELEAAYAYSKAIGHLGELIFRKLLNTMVRV